MDAVVSVQFLLQLYDGLVPFIQTAGQRNHNVSLLEQQLLVPIHLSLLFLDLSALSLHLLKLDIVLLPY